MENKIEKNRKQYEKEKAKLKTREDWEKFRDKWFNPESWEKLPKDEFQELLNRPPVKKGGYTWYPLVLPKKIPADLRYEEDLFDVEMLKALEPERYKYLKDRKDLGRRCSYCQVYVESYKPEKCPFCGRKLFWTNIGDD